MKKNISPTTVVVILVVVVLAVALIGWKLTSGSKDDVDPTAVDDDAATMKEMQESMKTNPAGQGTEPTSPGG